MKKAECIERYGEVAWEKNLERTREWERKNPEKVKVKDRRNSREKCRKGGKHYEKQLEYKRTGLQGERERIRKKHRYKYRPYKMIIASDSQLHHQWIPETSEYSGVALVEAKPHQYGIIDVILILDGKITLLTEEEVRNGRKTNENQI